MSQPTTRYTTTAIVLHWLIALGIIFLLILGFYMGDIPKEAPKQTDFDVFNLGLYTWHSATEISPRTFYFNLHKSIGFTVLVLVVLRVLWRIGHKPPAPLSSYTEKERKLSAAVHHLLYLLMVAMPISGLMMTLNSKWGLSWFGIELLKGADNKEARDFYHEAHEFIGFIILVVVALHIIGALKHKFIDKDDTMKRMSLR